ncbi:MAG: DUF975 family protein [Lachnospiraceae bacterium]|nr:DUF975 family protein [Lachnospiraceae bacterium]
MSWTREELKARGKAAFYRNYWVCVLVAFILLFVGGNNGGGSCNTGSSSSSSYNNNYSSNYDYDDFDYGDYDYGDYDDYGSDFDDEMATGVLAAIGAIGIVFLIIFLVAFVLGLLLSAFVFNPFEVGGCYFFLDNAVSDAASVSGILAGFKSNYKGTVLTMFLRNLYIGLWTLLFIVPGIIKTYEYRMIPYILADHPEMDHKEVFALSKKMMDGEKWNAFVLDLSFLGWAILSAFTCGILAIFYVNPYIHATNAELYLALKRNKCQSSYDNYGSVYSNYSTGSTYDNSFNNNYNSNNSFDNNYNSNYTSNSFDTNNNTSNDSSNSYNPYN